MKRSVAHLPLHTGQAPAWLFRRMHRLAGAITQTIVGEYGPAEMLARLADPAWFQAFGCVLGFDWHSSGLTTVTCGAMKEAYRTRGGDLGIHVAGGKGAVSRKTPDEIAAISERRSLPGDRLIYASRMAAKVDSAAVQDGYDIYAHTFFFADDSSWCVVQQGMNGATGYARRYHWLSRGDLDFVCEPHHGIDSEAAPGEQLCFLNMVAREAEASRRASVQVAALDPERILREVQAGPSLFLPAHHPVRTVDIDPKRLSRILRVLHEHSPADFERLLGLQGVGPRTIRSLALIAELIYDARQCRRDPATFSYAHGGKDGHPFPVDRETYDRNIAILEAAVRRAKISPNDKDQSLRRLAAIVGAQPPRPHSAAPGGRTAVGGTISASMITQAQAGALPPKPMPQPPTGIMLTRASRGLTESVDDA